MFVINHIEYNFSFQSVMCKCTLHDCVYCRRLKLKIKNSLDNLHKKTKIKPAIYSEREKIMFPISELHELK
jgi:hypothetical protein